MALRWRPTRQQKRWRQGVADYGRLMSLCPGHFLLRNINTLNYLALDRVYVCMYVYVQALNGCKTAHKSSTGLSTSCMMLYAL